MAGRGWTMETGDKDLVEKGRREREELRMMDVQCNVSITQAGNLTEHDTMHWYTRTCEAHHTPIDSTLQPSFLFLSLS